MNFKWNTAKFIKFKMWKWRTHEEAQRLACGTVKNIVKAQVCNLWLIDNIEQIGHSDANIEWSSVDWLSGMALKLLSNFFELCSKCFERHNDGSGHAPYHHVAPTYWIHLNLSGFLWMDKRTYIWTENGFMTSTLLRSLWCKNRQCDNPAKLNNRQ